MHRLRCVVRVGNFLAEINRPIKGNRGLHKSEQAAFTSEQLLPRVNQG
jgi:hypothetical protein